MKILVLTAPYSDGAKIQLIVDKIVAYREEYGYTEVSMLDGHSYYVKESAAFITQQLTSAAINSYIVYNKEEE